MYIHAAGWPVTLPKPWCVRHPLDALIAACKPIPFICVAQWSLPWAYWC